MTARRFHVRSYAGRHTVYEILPRGERAVSPSYADKTAAASALRYLESNPATPRVATCHRLANTERKPEL